MFSGEWGPVERDMSCGVPQGSVLGPTLWNMFYDDLLRLRLPEGVVTVGFADDVGVLTTNHTSEGIEAATNAALETVDEWIREHGLELAHTKTEAVMLTSKWAYRLPVLYSGGIRIPVKRSVKYLGVTLDPKLTFTRHIRAVMESAIKAAKAVGRLMPNVGGPSVTKRRLLSTVVTSKLLYAAPVWASRATRFKTNKDMLGRAQRLAALRITRCYKTVSTMAAFFLAEIPPTDLLAKEREEIRMKRSAEPGAAVSAVTRETRSATVQEWQSRWAAEQGVAGWTRRVLPSVHRWIGRPPGAPVIYRLAQVLSGHGSFGEYLHRFGLLGSPECPHCGAAVDDACHTAFICPVWDETRAGVSAVLGRPPIPEDIEELLCGGGTQADRGRRPFLDMVERIMAAKEDAERERQRLPRGNT